MIDILHKQCDETKEKIEKLYKLLDSIIRTTDAHFTGCEMRSDRTGLSFGVIFDNRLIGSIIMNFNDMTITCNKIDDYGNIHASCVRSIDSATPYKEEYLTSSDKLYTTAARNWFFDISVAPDEYVMDAPIEESVEVPEPVSTTDAGTEVEEVPAE